MGSLLCISFASNATATGASIRMPVSRIHIILSNHFSPSHSVFNSILSNNPIQLLSTYRFPDRGPTK